MNIKTLTPAQCRAARALIGWSRKDLVNASGVAERTIIDFERGARRPISATMQALAAAFERAGVEFVDDRGVQLRPDPEISG